MSSAEHEGQCQCGSQSIINKKRRLRYKFQFSKHLKFHSTNYVEITSMKYLVEKYGKRRAEIIHAFIRCIHKKINHDVNRVTDSIVMRLSPWVKTKLFLLLVTLSQRGGPEYWSDKKSEYEDKSRVNCTTSTKNLDSSRKGRIFHTLIEQIMRQNINEDFDEDLHDENYVLSSIWANFMEGLINHYLEQIIVPNSEMKVCLQLYKPMMKIISLYNEYNDLIEKSERNGFLVKNDQQSGIEHPQEKINKAQKLLWKARQDIPKTISKELTLLSEMYATLSADEQDYQLDEFVCCAEEYIEWEYLPSLIEVLFVNCGSIHFWKIMYILEPFFYYIEEFDEQQEEKNTDQVNHDDTAISIQKSDPRVATLEKICEIAAKQKWI